MSKRLIVSLVIFIAIAVFTTVAVNSMYNKRIVVDDTPNKPQTPETPEKPNFRETGAVIRNNPGLKKDTYYLIYEKPGKPALKAELVFGPKSECDMTGKLIACMLLSMTFDNTGDRMEVVGYEKDGVVDVVTLTKLSNNKFGYIKAVRNAGPNIILDIDPVEMLTGDRAYEMAVLDTGCKREEIEACEPGIVDGLYIRNVDKAIETHLLSADADIKVFKTVGSVEIQKVSVKDFVKQYTNKSNQMDQYPFFYKLDADTITELTAQYLP